MLDGVMLSLRRKLKQFKTRDVYNMGARGIFFRLTPDITVTFKGDPCYGVIEFQRTPNCGCVCQCVRILQNRTTCRRKILKSEMPVEL
jgi:hypothetical protein